MARIIPDPLIEFWHRLTKGRQGHRQVFLIYLIMLIVARFTFFYKLFNYFFNSEYLLSLFLFLLYIVTSLFAEWVQHDDSKRLHTMPVENDDVIPEDDITEQLYRFSFIGLIGPFPQRLKLCVTIIFKFLVRIVFGIEIIWIYENWEAYAAQHQEVRKGRIYDSGRISQEEVDAFLFTKGMQCTKSLFCLSSAFIKNIPISLIILYEISHAKFPDSLCCWKTILSLAIVLVTVLFAAYINSNYEHHNWEYVKALEFKHVPGQRDIMCLKFPSQLVKYASWINNACQIVVRLYIFGYFFHKPNYILAIQLGVLLFIWNFFWIAVNPKTRPSYENPPHGISHQLFSIRNLFHRFVNIFCFHGTPPSYQNIIWYHAGLSVICGYLLTYLHVWGEIPEINEETYANVTATGIKIAESFTINAFSYFEHKLISVFGIDFKIVNSTLASEGIDELVSNNKTYCDLDGNVKQGIFFTVESTEIFNCSYWLLMSFTILPLLCNLFYVKLLNYCQVNIKDVPVLLENSFQHWKRFIDTYWQSKFSCCAKSQYFFLKQATFIEKEKTLDYYCGDLCRKFRRSPEIWTGLELVEIETESCELRGVPTEHPFYKELLLMEKTIGSNPDNLSPLILYPLYRLFNTFVDGFEDFMMKMSSHNILNISITFENHQCDCNYLIVSDVRI